MISLILGGARSGKSAYAEQLARQSVKHVVYLATAQGLDAEMQERIRHHQARRPADWRLSEEPLALAAKLVEMDAADTLIIVDCLTLWLTNLLYSIPQSEHGPVRTPPRFEQERAALLETLPRLQAEVILVSNEVGMGITPMAASARWFVDEAGRLHQALAKVADSVVFVVAGLPLRMK